MSSISAKKRSIAIAIGYEFTINLAIAKIVGVTPLPHVHGTVRGVVSSQLTDMAAPRAVSQLAALQLAPDAASS